MDSRGRGRPQRSLPNGHHRAPPRNLQITRPLTTPALAVVDDEERTVSHSPLSSHLQFQLDRQLDHSLKLHFELGVQLLMTLVPPQRDR